LADFKKIKIMVQNFCNNENIIDLAKMQEMLREIKVKQRMYQILFENEIAFDSRTLLQVERDLIFELLSNRSQPVHEALRDDDEFKQDHIKNFLAAKIDQVNETNQQILSILQKK
jgi:hypothetical protein